MDLRSVVKQVADMLECSFEEEGAVYFLNVPVSEGEDVEGEEDDEDDRTQMVMVELDVDGEVVLVSTDVGPWSEDQRSLSEVLRLMRDAIFSRVYLSEATEDEPEQLVVESAIVAEKVEAEFLASVVSEVAEVADEIQLMLFDEEGDVDEEGDEDEEDDELAD